MKKGIPRPPEESASSGFGILQRLHSSLRAKFRFPHLQKEQKHSKDTKTLQR